MLSKIWPQKIFLVNGKLYIILKRNNLAIGEHSNFFNY